MPDADFVNYMKQRFVEQVGDVANRLRSIADDIERESQRDDRNAVGSPEYGWKAAHVVHAVAWGVANCSLDQLVHTASELDRIEGTQREA